MEELKGCPFCGGKALFYVTSSRYSNCMKGFEFSIKCNDCKAELPKNYNVDFTLSGQGEINTLNDNRRDAIDAWNKRAISK